MYVIKEEKKGKPAFLEPEVHFDVPCFDTYSSILESSSSDHKPLFMLELSQQGGFILAS